VSPRPRSRADLIGDTAIEVLAAEGARGLTHRAVDRAAGLPAGSTSNYARTREALLKCALTRITELEAADAGAMAQQGGGKPGAMTGAVGATGGMADAAELLAGPIAAMLHRGLTRGRTRLLARYELALESTRRPDLRAIYEEAGRPLREPAAALLRAAGSRAPERHARMLIAWCEGVQFDSLAGAGSADPPDLEELHSALRDLIRGMAGNG
jgi:DNA-binding transcriptional regulator YbjK